MSRMADMLVEIEELYKDGFDAKDISEMSGIQLSMVLDAIDAYGTAWDEEMIDDEADPGEMDGDWDSSMASAGYGTDEDYGYFGDDF